MFNSFMVLQVKRTWHVAKYGIPYSEFVYCISSIQLKTQPKQWGQAFLFFGFCA